MSISRVPTPLLVAVVLKLKFTKALLWAAACKLAVVGAGTGLTGSAVLVPVLGVAYAAYSALF